MQGAFKVIHINNPNTMAGKKKLLVSKEGTKAVDSYMSTDDCHNLLSDVM